MKVEYPVKDIDPETSEDEEEEEESVSVSESGKQTASEHKDQLQRLKEKDPEFYKYLQERDEELLAFNEEDSEEDADDAEMLEDEGKTHLGIPEGAEKPSRVAITTEMVDSWCNAVRESGRVAAVRSLMKAFRIACHYGDDSGDDSSTKFSIMSSAVFNKIMLFVLSEMDGILRELMGLPASGGKKETVKDLMTTRRWKNYAHLLKSYLGNSLHVLNQMTDTQMISFTLRRLKYSAVFLAAFPSLLRKYIKVALHFWGTGGGALPVVSFLFLRDLCVRLGPDCFDECIRGLHKAYVMNCQFVNAMNLQHIQFLGNCVVELLRVDLPTAYQHAFVFIRQLAMILRDAITMKTKESFRRVYEWKFMNSLELWTAAVCVFSSEADFRPLAYPLTQVISGTARLVPTARYFPLRLRCVRMLNRIAASAGTYVPVSMLLLDMLEMKELNRPPTGGVGKAVDLRTILKVSKPTLKTRAFQEACVFSVVEELAEHLAQWSCSVAFFELSFIPAVRLRSFCKTTKVDRFRKEMRQLIHQIDANAEFTNERRKSVTFRPNDPAVESFLEAERKTGKSPVLQYVVTLHQKAKQREDSLKESRVFVGENSSEFGKRIAENDGDVDGDEKGHAVFNSSWLPGGKPNADLRNELAMEEDVVKDLVLSSDEEDHHSPSSDNNETLLVLPQKSLGKKRKFSDMSKTKSQRKPDHAKSSAPAGQQSKKLKPDAISSKSSSQQLKKSKKRRKRKD